jgi:hypothetical protein
VAVRYQHPDTVENDRGDDEVTEQEGDIHASGEPSSSERRSAEKRDDLLDLPDLIAATSGHEGSWARFVRSNAR